MGTRPTGKGNKIYGLPGIAKLKRAEQISTAERRRRRNSGGSLEDGDGGGSNPKPPIPDDQFFHDFTTNTLGPLFHVRGTPASGISHEALPQLATNSNTPIYTGARLQAPSTWYSQGVGYGVQVEGASENHLASSNQLTGAAWDVSGATVAGDVVTATADGGTITQAFDLGSAKTFVFSAWIESVAGEQSVEMTVDGTTWQKVDINPAGRFSLPSLAQTGEVGVRFYNAGDSIKLRWLQFEPGTTPTSWIDTGVNPPQVRNRVLLDSSGNGAGTVDGFALQLCATTITDRAGYVDADPVFMSLESDDGTSGMRIRHSRASGAFAADWWTPGGGTVSTTLNTIDTLANDSICIKTHKSSSGLVCIINNITTTIAGLSGPAESPLKKLRLGADHATSSTADINVQWVRYDPTGVPLSEVQSWPAWVHPAPVIVPPQPQSIHFGATEEVEPVTLADLAPVSGTAGTPTPLSAVATGDPVISYAWEFDANDGGGYKSIATHAAIQPTDNTDTASPTITMPTEPGTYSYRVTVDNAAIQPKQSTAAITSTVMTTIPSGELVVLFSDLVDGKNNGWHEDPDNKGVAVTIYGAGFGNKATNGGKIFMGEGPTRVQVPDIYIVEWGQPQYPAQFPGMLQTTFHIPATIVGDAPITVEIDDGEGGTLTSAPLPFHARTSGQIIYLDANNGKLSTEGADGTWGNAFSVPGEMLTKVRQVLPGDHYYMLGGDYLPYLSATKILTFSGGTDGTEGNSISWAAYPGVTDVKLANRSFPIEDSKGAKAIASLVDRISVSKMLSDSWHGCMQIQGADHVRLVGVKTTGLGQERPELQIARATGDFSVANATKNNAYKVLGCEFVGDPTATELSTESHAIYPGGGGTGFGGAEVGWNYIRGWHINGGSLISHNMAGTGSSRITVGETVKARSTHHNIIDCRMTTTGPDNAQASIGIGCTSAGDNRSVEELPISPPYMSEQWSIYNNVIIGQAQTLPLGDEQVMGIKVNGRTANVMIANNTIIGFGGDHNSRAIGFSDVSEYSELYDGKYTFLGNHIINSTVEYRSTSGFNNAKNISAITMAFSGNNYESAKPGTTMEEMAGQPGLQLGAVSGLVYDLDAMTFSLPADSPISETAADYQLASHDINNKAYTVGGKFSSGAIIAEDDA